MFCGVLLYKYQPKDEERMVVDMMYRQDIEDEVVDCIRNSGGVLWIMMLRLLWIVLLLWMSVRVLSFIVIVLRLWFL